MDAGPGERLDAEPARDTDAMLNTDDARGTDAALAADASLGIDAAPSSDAAPGPDATLGADLCTDAESDAGRNGSGLEAGIPRPTNVGAACASWSDCGCRADCVLGQYLSGLGVTTLVRYPDGYCTAACKQTAECGRDAKCPLGDAFDRVDIPQQYSAAISDLLETSSYCYKLCITPNDCRSGYYCSTASAMLVSPDAGTLAGAADFARSVLEGATEKYCLPHGQIVSTP